eukprot:16971-Heterococcus_DN1.PRE.1
MAIQRREKHNMRSILGVFASAKKLAKFSGPNFDGYSTSKGNNKEEEPEGWEDDDIDGINGDDPIVANEVVIAADDEAMEDNDSKASSVFQHLGDLPELDAKAEVIFLCKYLLFALAVFLPGAIIQAVRGCVLIQAQVDGPLDNNTSDEVDNTNNTVINSNGVVHEADTNNVTIDMISDSNNIMHHIAVPAKASTVVHPLSSTVATAAFDHHSISSGVHNSSMSNSQKRQSTRAQDVMPGENTLYNVSRGLNRRTSTKARNVGSSYGMNASNASNNNMSSVMNRHNTASQSNYGDRRTSRVSMQQRRMSITRTNDRKNLAAEPFQDRGAEINDAFTEDAADNHSLTRMEAALLRQEQQRKQMAAGKKALEEDDEAEEQVRTFSIAELKGNAFDVEEDCEGLNPLGKTLNLWMLRPVMMKKLAIKTIELLDGNEDKEITRQEFLNAM